MKTTSTTRSVYVGERATLSEVVAAVNAWQAATGDTTEFDVEADGDLHPGMGFAVDVFAAEYDAQLAAAYRLADGIRPLLSGIPVAVDRELAAATRI